MHFRFALELSDIDLWNTDLLDTHLDLLSPDKYKDIPSMYFVCLHKIFKRSSKHVFKTSSRHVFMTSLRHIFKTSSRHVFKTFSRRLQNVFARRLQDVLEDVKLLRWRCVEDVFKTNKCLLGIGNFASGVIDAYLSLPSHFNIIIFTHNVQFSFQNIKHTFIFKYLLVISNYYFFGDT